jgi:hypothetical protein
MNNHLAPRLYVHCGFHKTGSTALQAALRASEEPLRQAGFLYPYAGSGDKPGHANSNPFTNAHHNIAYEIDRHWLFLPYGGAFEALAEEAKSFAGNVIVSAEAFESALTEPEGFLPFQSLAQETGRRLTMVIYLRDQLSYCESLYLELLKHGERREFRRHVEEILETGILRSRETAHQFDYQRTLSKWAQLPHVDVILRNYHALAGGSILSDFAQITGLDGILHARSGKEKVNQRDTTATSLALFYGNRVERKPTPLESCRISLITQSRSRLTSSATTRRRFIERFHASNLRLCEAWGLPIAGLDMTAPQPLSEVTLEQCFSFETHCAIRSGTVPDTRFAPAEAKQTAWMAGVKVVEARVALSETVRHWSGELARYRRWYARRIGSRIFSGDSSSVR